ncbi:MAG TPA: hypothetical protein VFE84_07275, partial [Patescibacteria group bacterium]|nr:hypothetical protein [Patescibacteria group bacterium]
MTLAILTMIGFAGATSESVFANCQFEGPYEVWQCAKSTWFAPAPAGSGTISGAWWAIGFGNRNDFAVGADNSPEGSGFWPTPPPGDFIGVDSGYLPALATDGPLTLDLVDASAIAGLGAPAGALCFSSRSNWGSPGIDSCIDINRTDTVPGGALDMSDNYVNPYWDMSAGPGTLYY